MENIVHGRRFVDLTGKRFGYATVIRFHSKAARGRSKWFCRCDCGTEFVAFACNLVKPDRLNSCGCKLQERYEAGGGFKSHGDSSRKSDFKKTWTAWVEMRRRVLNPKHKRYCYYGARGIRICAGFLQYEGFKNVIGKCPPDKSSLGRINNDLNYSCGQCGQCQEHQWTLNVRWENHQEQMNNQSRSLRFDGKSVAEIATEKGVSIGQVLAELGLRPWTGK